MLSEEALVLLGGFLALGLLVLGIWELLVPSRSRYPVRRPMTAPRHRTLERRLPRTEPLTPSPAPERSAPAEGTVAAPGPSRVSEPAPAAEGGRMPNAMERRLWRSYTNLGLQQIEERKFVIALDPLFQALRLPVAPEQLFETRVALVRAFEGIIAEASEEVRALAAAGDHPRAELRVEKLWTMLRSGVDQGIPQDDLSELLTRTQRLFEEISR